MFDWIVVGIFKKFKIWHSIQEHPIKPPLGDKICQDLMSKLGENWLITAYDTLRVECQPIGVSVYREVVEDYVIGFSI